MSEDQGKLTFKIGVIFQGWHLCPVSQGLIRHLRHVCQWNLDLIFREAKIGLSEDQVRMFMSNDDFHLCLSYKLFIISFSEEPHDISLSEK